MTKLESSPKAHFTNTLPIASYINIIPHDHNTIYYAFTCYLPKPLPKSLRLPHSHIHIEVKLALKMEGRDEDVRVGANRYGERQPIGTAAQTQDAKDYREAPPAPLFEPRELTSWSFYRAGIAEFVGTFLFLYVTVLTVMGVAKSPSKCSTVGVQGIAWSFGGMIFALVYCTAGISG